MTKETLATILIPGDPEDIIYSILDEPSYPAEGGEPQTVVVRTRNFSAAADALLKPLPGGYDFWLFADLLTDDLNPIRREDLENYGLVRAFCGKNEAEATANADAYWGGGKGEDCVLPGHRIWVKHTVARVRALAVEALSSFEIQPD